MAIETCEKHAVEGVGRVAERASIRDDNRRILCTHKDGRCEEAKVHNKPVAKIADLNFEWI